MELTFGKRAALCQGVGRRLLRLMEEKRTNLCVAVDVSSASELLRIIRAVGEETAVIKTHVDMLDDWRPDLVGELRDLSNELDFLLLEDRKFADIGKTVRSQYAGGSFRIAEWAHLVTAHAISGEGIITALQEGTVRERGCLLIAQMSTASNFLSADYAKQVLALGRRHPDFVTGFICANREDELRSFAGAAGSGFVRFTPGAHLMATGDRLDQKYTHPRALVAAGSDVVIVGRAITEALNPPETARQYREVAWSAYLERISSPTSGR